MTEAERLLQALVVALDSAFISTWQSTAYWQGELDEAREYLDQCAQEQGGSDGDSRVFGTP